VKSAPAPTAGRRTAFALLAALLVALPALHSRADDDLKKEIRKVEKEIEETKKKLDAARNGPKPPPAPGTVPESAIARMNWRCIGPANMGGRITAFAVVESDPTTYYVGTASGGLLKTTNNGTTFTFAFDKQATVSVGDVAVSQSNPNIVYVGTGENNPRNSVSYGDGVYKSTDAGKTWQNVGLKESFSTGRIVIHPTNPDVVYVAAMGRVWGPNAERGVFKTEDGGKSWKKVLYVNERTGAIDLRFDPFDPEVLVAALWERQRDEFDGFFGTGEKWPGPDQYGPVVAHGPGGGLFKTTDGGKHWKKLTGADAAPGLPTVATGRIGLDYSRKTKGLLYAIIDTEAIGKGRPPLKVYMGITGEDVKEGAKLKAVIDDAPAGKAGLQSGDIVTAADGKPVKSYDALLDFLATKKPGDEVKFGVLREKEKKKGKDDKKEPKERKGDKAEKKEAKKETESLTVTMKLVARPARPESKGKGNPRSLSPGGVVFAVPNPDNPVRVAEVPKGGAAEKAGVKAGMIAVAVNGKEVGNWKEFRAELRVGPKVPNPRKAGDKVKVAFKGEQNKQFDVELALEMAEVRVAGTGTKANPLTQLRPFLMNGTIGGQQANVQNSQGKDGDQTGGVYVSRDNGATWQRVNSLNPRPFYFSGVRADPTDDRTLYVFGDSTLWKSTDGGKKFESARASTVHPDHHAMWIDPRDGRHMLVGCDGGFYATYDRGQTWDHLNTTALGQFYSVAVDTRRPYRVYGGLQDNGCWGGPSRTLRGTGPTNEDWQFLNGGDGFVCRIDPQDPDWVYAESQNGFMNRQNLKTGERKGIRPRPVKEGEALRFNWNTPYILSEHNPHIFYCGAQYVFRSVERGDNLKPISPELTRTKQGSVTAIAESPKNADVLWAGTDDGYIWVTRDGGQKWTNVTDNLKKAGLPGSYWVASVEPGRKVEGRCYACLDAHRSNDDKPYLFVTEDYGQTWKPIANNLPAFGSTRVLREDATTSEILYCGTEFAFWVSINRGQTWAKLNNDLPTVAVHEVAQPTTASEIVIATHGRSVWVLDVASLRQMKPEAEKAAVTLFAPAAVTRWQYGPGSFPYSRDVRKFYGTNPPPGGAIDYLLGAPAKEVSMKVLDVGGKDVPGRVAEIDGKGGGKMSALPAGAGFHRVQFVPSKPGTFRVVLTVDGKEHAQTLTVENDPNAAPNAVITDGPELLGKENKPKGGQKDAKEKEGTEEEDD
jgi:photosystem II stability/assembly factor-like uncharacterized protein